MRLASPVSTTPVVVPVPPDPTMYQAVQELGLAFEVAQSADSEPATTSVTTLVGGSQDAADAADLLTRAGRNDIAELARDASSDLDSAATAARDENPDVAAEVVHARGADAVASLQKAFELLGFSPR